MLAKCSAHKLATGTYTSDYLLNRLGDCAFYKTYNNHYYMIMGISDDAMHNIREIILEERVNVPLWKQSMEMQMGRIPQATSSRRIMVQEVTPEQVRGRRIEVLQGYYL